MTKTVWVVDEYHLDSFTVRRRQVEFLDKQRAYNYCEKLQGFYGKWVCVKLFPIFLNEDDPLESEIDLFDNGVKVDFDEGVNGLAFSDLIDNAGE